MDEALHAIRRDRVLAALFPLFLASGATSLVYETLWERQLHLVFGTSQIAVATVLAAFMTGLAAGGFLAARLVHRAQRPLRAYALLEAGVGAYALAFPLIVGALEPLYQGFYSAMSPSPLVFAVFQFLLLGVTLLPATTCMGATLPLLVRFAAQRDEAAGAAVGRLYGANTLGAVLGVGLAGFLLLPWLGLSLTTLATASGNVLLCAAARWLDRQVDPLAPEPAPSADRPQAALGALAAVAFLAGVASLTCEVAWFRLLVLILGGSAYAFSIMLLAFLVGIGLGGLAGGRLADRAWQQGGSLRVLYSLAAAQAGVALLTWLVMFTFGELPFLFVALYNMVDPYLGWIWPMTLLVALMVMTPPALLMGATFPLLVRAAADHAVGLASPVGRLYGWNTVGAILGASVGGLLLLPSLRVVGALLVAVCLNTLAALLVLRRAHPDTPPGVQAAAGVGLLLLGTLLFLAPPPWNPLLMTAGMYKYVSDLEPEERTRQGIWEFAVEPYELLFYEEGLSSVVTVARSESGNIWLANNGKVDASTSIDMPTQVMVAHLPFAFMPEPERVLVIGLASGITAGSVALHSAPKKIDIVELEPAIVEASHLFDGHNNRPLDDERVTLIANDGRNHVNLSPPAAYDLIVSEPSNPWQTGVSNLFTREFLELGKSRLAPGGVWSQWVQMYGMDTADLRALLATFISVYDNVLLFSTIEDADLVLVGSDGPLNLSAEAMGRMLELDAAVAMDLRLVGAPAAEDMIARLQLTREEVARFAEGSVLNTDDNMRIEYSAPLHLHEQTAEANFYALLRQGRGPDAPPLVPLDAVEGLTGRLRLAEAYARREDWLRATLTLKADAEAPDAHPDVLDAYRKYQEALVAEFDAEDE